MKVISVPTAIVLAVAALYFTQSEYSRDPFLSHEDWMEVPATISYWPGLRMADAVRLRATEAAGDELEREIRSSGEAVAIDGFMVARREVSCAEFAAFLASDAGAEIPPPLGWSARTAPAGRESEPATGMNLADAKAYARSRNARLPTEWEWEYAMRGDLPRYYPWGNEADASQAAVSLPKTVGAADSRFVHNGVFHGIGNVAEWTTSPFVAYSDYKGKGDFDAAKVVIRGGSISSPIARARVTGRAGANPSRGARHIGIRLVKTVR